MAWGMLLLWLALLLPLSVDNSWNIPLGHYDARLTYVAHACVLAALAWELLRGGGVRAFLHELRAARFPAAFSAMAAIGLLSLAHSENRFRSVAFLVWTFGTLMTVPWVVGFLERKLGPWVPRLLSGYLLVQVGVLAIDWVACTYFGATDGLIGRVFIHKRACRPHAWYQEPNYFASFALISLLWIRLHLSRETARFWKGFARLTLLSLLFGILLCTSRAGWVGAAGWLAIEAFFALRGRYGHRWFFRSRALAAALLAVALAAGTILAREQMAYRSKKDGSYRLRMMNLEATRDVFLEHPWVGVGPGSAGAYLVSHFPDHRYFEKSKYKDPALRERLRNDPLAYSLITELLSEWGILGTLAFLVGLVSMVVLPARGRDRWQIAWVLAVIYATSQTLPRYDLWLGIALVWAGRRAPGFGSGNQVQDHGNSFGCR